MPSPQFHAQVVAVPPVVVLLTFTKRGALPDAGVLVNDATGAVSVAAVTVIVCAALVFEPPAFVAVKVTE